jgi:hypothetical protein
MKTNVASTSIEVYHTEIKYRENSQDRSILVAFSRIGKPATYRMVQAFLNGIGIDWEVNVISRSINNLKGSVEKKRPVRIVWVKDDKCPVTGRKAQFYLPVEAVTNQQNLFE